MPYAQPVGSGVQQGVCPLLQLLSVAVPRSRQPASPVILIRHGDSCRVGHLTHAKTGDVLVCIHMGRGELSPQGRQFGRLGGIRFAPGGHGIHHGTAAHAHHHILGRSAFNPGHRIAALITPQEHRLRASLRLHATDITQAIPAQNGLSPGLHAIPGFFPSRRKRRHTAAL